MTRPVYPTTRVIIEQMGLTLITADFNDLSALKQVVDEQQPDAALVQHTRSSRQDRYVLADVLATLRAAGVPALTDDNYAVMKVARIGCECGANVSTFSCFKLFGPEGVGAVVGDADVISRIRATLYSGGSQIQGAQALEVLRGLVLAPVMHAVQAGVSERLLALLNGGAVAGSEKRRHCQCTVEGIDCGVSSADCRQSAGRGAETRCLALPGWCRVEI